MATALAFSPIRVRLSLKADLLFRNATVCRRCLQHQSKPKSKSIPPTRSKSDSPFLKAFRQPRQQPLSSRPSSSTAAAADTPLSALGRNIAKARPHATSPTKPEVVTSTSSWPETSNKSVAYWLLASATSVFGIVIFGGLTRLTESGLSITEWRPLTGSFPPTSAEDWEEEFARYKLSPEFKMLNSRMNVDDFKQIYWMEWGHRLWGRVVGLTFLLPTVYFVLRRRVSKPMAVRLVGICGLIGFQGVLGWWMVKSGLKDDLFELGQHPRVSQYRLAAHLGTAFVAYLAMLWNGLSILRTHRLLADPTAGLNHLDRLLSPQLRPLKRSLAALSALVFITVLSGALVAGLDAGLIYNDFPWMGTGLLPPKREMLDPFYAHTPDQRDLVWRNMLENPVLVQLDHRILATSTFCAVLALWAYSRFRPQVRAALPVDARKGVRGLLHLVTLQVTLGITTLWYLVPTPLAAAHQAGALLLLTGVAVLGSRVRVSARTLRIVKAAAKRAAPGNKAVEGDMTALRR